MSELPKGWASAKIGELASKIGSGATPRGGEKAYKASGIPLLRSLNIHFDGVRDAGVAFIDDDQARKLDNATVSEGDVLLNITGASIGRVAVAPNRFEGARVNQHVCIIRVSEGAEAEFVARFLASPNPQRIIRDENYGVTRQALTKGMIEEFSIPFPPLHEQQRIVRKLETLSALTTTARAHLSAITKLVERYRQSIIDAIFAPLELTVPLIELVDPDTGIPYGIVQTGDHQEDGVPTVRAGDIKGFRLLEDGLKRVRPDVAEQYGRTKLEGGEVLIAIRGSVGETCIVPRTMAGNNISREVALIPVSKNTNASFIMYFLRSAQAAKYIKANTKGVAQTGINLRDLKRLLCPDLEVHTQAEIVRVIESAFAKVDRLASGAAKALKLTDKLNERILSKAFAGELVPQDPDNEPASALLDRIREARGNATKSKRQPRKPRTMKKKANLASLLDDWPSAGMTFEELRGKASGSYDQVKEELFELMRGDQPKISQEFDSTRKMMRLKKVAS